MPVRRKKYSKEEIHDAGIAVMRSLNKMNKRGTHSLRKKVPGLSSLPSVVSKSAMKRRNRRENENLGGTDLSALADSLPDLTVPEPDPAPRISAQRRHTQLIARETQVQKERLKAGLSAEQIREKIRQRLAQGDI